jgi:hypothetical protein
MAPPVAEPLAIVDPHCCQCLEHKILIHISAGPGSLAFTPAKEPLDELEKDTSDMYSV